LSSGVSARTPAIKTESLRGFPQSPQTSPGIVHVRPFLLPFTSFQIHYSLNLWPITLRALLNKRQNK
jgi:hypothetical protein